MQSIAAAMRRRQNTGCRKKCGGIRPSAFFEYHVAFCAKCLLRSQHTYLDDGAHAFVCPDTHDLAVATMKDGERSAAHPQPLRAAGINPAMGVLPVFSRQSSDQAGAADE